MIRHTLAAMVAAVVLAPTSFAMAEDIRAKSIIESMLAKQAAREKATPYYLVRESHSTMGNQELLLLYGRPCELERQRQLGVNVKDGTQKPAKMMEACDSSSAGYTVVRPKELEYIVGGKAYMLGDQFSVTAGSEMLKILGYEMAQAGAVKEGKGAAMMSILAENYAQNPRYMNEIERADARDAVMDMRKFGSIAQHLGNINLRGREAFVLIAGNVGEKGNTFAEAVQLFEMLTLEEIVESRATQADYTIDTVMLAVDAERLVPLAMGIWGTTKQKKGKKEQFQIFREDRDYFKVAMTDLYIPKTTTMAMRMKLSGMDKKQQKELEKALKDYEKMKAELDAMKQAQEAAGGMLGGFMDDQIAKMEEMMKMMEVADAAGDVDNAEVTLESIQKIFNGELVGNVQTNHAAVGGELETLAAIAYMPFAQPGGAD